MDDNRCLGLVHKFHLRASWGGGRRVGGEVGGGGDLPMINPRKGFLPAQRG
jgi:hypothetical protein